MEVKTMTEQEFCQSCQQRQSCQAAYEKLSSVKGPSVLLKVLVAFLLPMLVFIIALVVADRFLVGRVSGRDLRIFLEFLIAVLTTIVCMFSIKVVRVRNDGER